MTLAEAFASLPPEQQARLIKLHIGNELFDLAGGGEEGTMSAKEVDAELKLIETSALLRALPQKDREGILTKCGIVREMAGTE